MSGKKDWLYRLIFDHIEELWKRVCQTNDQRATTAVSPQRRQPALERLLVQQLTEVDISKDFLTGTVGTSWQYSGENFEPLSENPETALVIVHEPILGGRPYHFFRQGVVRFFIIPDRKVVHFAYLVGPLNGRGYTCAVHGQGRRGTLGSPQVHWVS